MTGLIDREVAALVRGEVSLALARLAAELRAMDLANGGRPINAAEVADAIAGAIELSGGN